MTSRNWTTVVRERIYKTVPEGQWLPSEQPEYVRSWIYVFGAATLAALLVVVGTGVVLAMGGSTWWHTSSTGHFVNSLHLWSVEILMAVMVIHLWGKFVMAAWRGKRGMTWVTGAVCFLVAIGAAFTGYLSQSNFESQWISTQAKDSLNSVGVGSRFNPLDAGQMLMWHVTLLPALIAVLVVWHIVLVRRHGIAPPIDAVGTTPRHTSQASR